MNTIWEQLPEDVALATGNALTVLEHYNHAYGVMRGFSALFFLTVDDDDIRDFLSAFDTYYYCVAFDGCASPLTHPAVIVGLD